MQQLEDVVDSYTGFNVRGIAHDVAGRHTVAHRKQEQFGIVALVRVVFICQRSPKATDTEHFSPLQLLEEGNAVEQFAVHVVAQVEGSVTVVQELHVVDEVERFVVLSNV